MDNVKHERFDEQNAVDLGAQIDRWKFAVTALAAALVGAYFTYFALVVNLDAAVDPDKWGTFGDFFGGLMNPIVAFAAFFWLTQSVKLQKQELAETRRELKIAAEAQQEMVRQGVLSVQLSALTALSQVVEAEYKNAREVMTSLQAKRDAAEKDGHLEEFHENILELQDPINAKIRSANIERDRLKKEMKDILDSLSGATRSEAIASEQTITVPQRPV